MKTASLSGNARGTRIFGPPCRATCHCTIRRGTWHEATGQGGHRHRATQRVPPAGCLRHSPEGGSPPSHNQGSGLLKWAPSSPLSGFTLPRALPSQPSHLSPGSLGLTTLLLGKRLAVLLGLTVFTFWGL